MYPQAFVNYLIHFHCDRDYFECHEILEEYWKEDPVPERKPYWVGLIQIAVSLYHHRRGNTAGALKMMKSAIRICKDQKSELAYLGLQVDELIEVLQKKFHDIENGAPYKSINLPIADEGLLATCLSQAIQSGHSWGKASDIANKELIHKHTLRDRSEVIAERQKQFLLKQERRSK
ncbi:DUF309 domain-containing protein [Bacillus sp. REN16]|uniref:DUF309 domain-containing protein n=1 Tax=Bacillus sp. REN16 TaxID=2887296 RepID=UPI001E539FA5|nr:DUF309 domain-containing protein [Bacillus sp. REN16]MCC3358262.1 DUF309 domain-containing protein [Bacillus sp. REN16]